jgi:hypothetical protein
VQGHRWGLLSLLVEAPQKTPSLSRPLLPSKHPDGIATIRSLQCGGWHLLSRTLSMRYWLLALSFLIFHAHAQTPFPGTAAPTLTFKETYVNVVKQEPGSLPEDQSFVIGAQRTLSIKGTAPLTGFDLSTIDESTTFSLALGGFNSSELENLSGYLTDDETWNPDQTGGSPDRSVDFPITGYDYDGNPVEIGTVALSWNASQVTFNVSINTVNTPLTEWGFSQSVLADDFVGDSVVDIGADLPAAFTFGPFSFDLKNCFVVGSATITPDPQGDLSTITLDGAIDSVDPTLSVSQPPAGKTILTESDGVTADFRYTLVGTVADTRKVGGVTYAGEIATVEVRLGTPTVAGDFSDAEVVLDENGNWSVPNAQLQVGKNVLTFRVTDGEGNTFTTTPRTVTVSTKGSVTVRADAQTGYAAGDGSIVGTVTFSGAASGQLVATANAAAASVTRPNIEAGLNCTAVATPKPGSVFDGWEGKLNGTLIFTAVTQRLVFECKPGLEVTGKFLPNPFATPLVGAYQGLITGDSAAERGIFKVTISKTGVLSGKVQIGALTLPIKGKVLGRGVWYGTVKRGAKIYTIEFNLNIGPNDERTIEGTVTGDGLDAALTADLTDWHKAKGAIPARLAAQAGTYNVLLPAAPANTDVAFPHGTGYGRVTISTLGVVKFVGKLGDATAVSASTRLVQHKDGTVFFPLFIPLDKKLGNVAGEVTFAVAPGTSLGGTLDWMEPLSSGVDPAPFAGQIALTGDIYTPVVGHRVMLESVSGLATLTLAAPLFTKPANVSPTELDRTYQVTLDAQQNILAASDATGELTAFKFKLKFNPKTGLFSGTYKDPVLNQTLTLGGAVIPQADGGAGFAAGVFVRGNKAGEITIGARGQ